jgi:hypothetical protein
MESWFNAGAAFVGVGNTLFQAASIRAREQNKLVEEARLILDHLRLISR